MKRIFIILLAILLAVTLIMAIVNPTWKLGIFEEPYTGSIFFCLLDHCVSIP